MIEDQAAMKPSGKSPFFTQYYSREAVMMATLGLFGAKGSSSHGFTIAALLPASSLKK
jgi:hypothetical protein